MSPPDEQFIRETQDIWEQRIGCRPSKAEAQEMIRNVSNLFLLLLEWESKENKLMKKQGKDDDDYGKQ